jgi:hypothetical protein
VFDALKKSARSVAGRLRGPSHSACCSEDVRLALGRIESRQLLVDGVVDPNDLTSAEFKVFSQWGEDGIIQYLTRCLPISRPYFVEFGVEDYQEANTRFLLQNNQWAGLVLDCSENHITSIQQSALTWKYELNAAACFVTASNINQVLSENGADGDIGLLSVDIDGNDYWIWKAIDVIKPTVVICEYNSLFGAEATVTVPYNPSFNRTKAHYSNLYYGASLSALSYLADKKGYALVAGNSHGSNAFFVRRDRLGEVRARQPSEVYRQTPVRESRDEAGGLTRLPFRRAQETLSHLPLIDVTTHEQTMLKECMPHEPR